LPPLPAPRQEHSVVSSGNAIYIIGGLRGTPSTFTAEVEAYNTTSRTYSTLPPLPSPVHHPNAASYNGKLYYLGGLTASGSNFAESKADGRVLVYDTATGINGTWKDVAPMVNARGGAAIGVYDGKIWLAGGLSAYRRGSDIVDVYDIASDTWTPNPELKLPEQRDHAGSAVVDGVLYVVGGRVSIPDQNRDTVFALDLKNPTKWTTRAVMPVARGGLAAAAAGGKIYSFGGEGNKNSAKGVFGDVAIYDVVKDSWENAPQMEKPRHGFGAATVGGKVYVAGGG
ncbi:galactose oxidase, partial [Tothia fuscella]